MKALKLGATVFLIAGIGNCLFGAERTAEQWQKQIDSEKPVAYNFEEGSIVGSLELYFDKGQVHMIYESESPKSGQLTIKFVRNKKDVLVLKGHLQSVFRDSGDTLYFADFEQTNDGCKVLAYDLRSGKRLWSTHLQAIGGIMHVRYENKVNMELEDGAIRIRGYEAFGDYVEIVDAKTGKTLAHRRLKDGQPDSEK